MDAGVEHVVLCPGSRSAPLAYALHAAEQAGLLSVHVRIDERSAAFTALGVGKGAGPAAVVTTSGTAVANLLPAVWEARHGLVPLLVLTADRPARLRGTWANQTTPLQAGAFAAAALLRATCRPPTRTWTGPAVVAGGGPGLGTGPDGVRDGRAARSTSTSASTTRSSPTTWPGSRGPAGPAAAEEPEDVDAEDGGPELEGPCGGRPRRPRGQGLRQDARRRRRGRRGRRAGRPGPRRPGRGRRRTGRAGPHLRDPARGPAGQLLMWSRAGPWSSPGTAPGPRPASSPTPQRLPLLAEPASGAGPTRAAVAGLPPPARPARARGRRGARRRPRPSHPRAGR